MIGQPRFWLRFEGLVALGVGFALYGTLGGEWLWLLPLLLLVDVSMLGYLAGPSVGATAYNLAHNWGTALGVLVVGVLTATPVLEIAGAVLVAHVGFDRVLGYGLKYPTAFQDTHLGRIGRRPPPTD